MDDTDGKDFRFSCLAWMFYKATLLFKYKALIFKILTV